MLAKVSCGGSVELVTDSLVNYHIFEKGPMVGSESTTNDMWTEFWDHAQRLGVHNVKMRWMKAHATAARVASGEVGVLDLFGNACADALAGRAAKQAQVAPVDARKVLKYVGLARLIQARAVSILIHLAEGNKGRPKTDSKKVKALAAISPGGLALASKHSLVMVAGSWHCSKCLRHMYQGSPELFAWFASDCDPGEGESVSRRVGLLRPSSLPEGVDVYAGRHQLHQSHALAVFRGLYYCQHCGYYASSAPKRLKLPCVGFSSQGRATIARIRGGLLPSGLSCWPCEKVVASNAVVL